MSSKSSALSATLTSSVVCIFDTSVGEANASHYAVWREESSCVGKNKARLVQNTSHVLTFYTIWRLVGHVKHATD